jgi:hypothetical protein
LKALSQVEPAHPQFIGFDSRIEEGIETSYCFKTNVALPNEGWDLKPPMQVL